MISFLTDEGCAHVHTRVRNCACGSGKCWRRKEDGSRQTRSVKQADARICNELLARRNAPPASVLYRRELETRIDRMLRSTRTGDKGRARESSTISIIRRSHVWL